MRRPAILLLSLLLIVAFNPTPTHAHERLTNKEHKRRRIQKQQQLQRRRLQDLENDLESDDSFPPQTCNSQLSVARCYPFPLPPDSAYNTSEFIVPCGECLTFETGGTYTFPGGLNIIGRLVIPPGIDITIVTTHIFVQGLWEITTSPGPIPHPTDRVNIILKGESDVIFHPYVDPNAPNRYGDLSCVSGCDVSHRPVIVAGGQVKINGMDKDCPAWSKIHELAYVMPEVTDAPQPRIRSPECGIDIPRDCRFTEDGDECTLDMFGRFGADPLQMSGRMGLYHEHRKARWQGPTLKMTPEMRGCLDTKGRYIMEVTMSHRLRRSEDVSLCASEGTSCPTMTLLYQNPDGHYRHRLVGIAAPHPDQTWFSFSSEEFSFTEEELNESNIGIEILISGPEENVALYFLSWKLTELRESFYPDPAAACDELVIRGNPGGIHLGTPWIASGQSQIEVRNDDDGNGDYYRHYERTSRNHALVQEIAVPICLTSNSQWQFSFKARTSSTDPGFQVYPLMKYTHPKTPDETSWRMLAHCQHQTAEDGWVECSGTFQNDNRYTTAYDRHIVIVTRRTAEIVDYKDISFKFNKNYSRARIVVPSVISNCWGVGAEILLTSPTVDWQQDEVTTINAVELSKDGKWAYLEVAMELVRFMVRALDREIFKPEVALLSRNIVFQPDEVDSPTDGGHFTVLHTPNVQQTLVGAAFVRFGQLGNIGKYPVHFHMNGDLSGTVISKNVVRESFQRCYVIHGTHSVFLHDNIAYDTVGHCFFLEDGCEVNNIITRNLGSRTKKATKLVAADETDNEPSTFWIPNGDNVVRGNVAAGGEGHGFWYEMKRFVRGQCGQLSSSKGVIPQEVDLRDCSENYAHSNMRHGITTYPGAGYKPKTHGVFRNNYVYRNRMSGYFFHNSGNVGVEGGVVADNRVNLDVDRAHTISWRNIEVIGYSPDFRNMIESSIYYNWRDFLCPGQYPLYGMQDHPYYFGGTAAKGTVMDNVTFTHFDNLGCEGSRPLSVEDFEDLGYFPPNTMYTNTHLKTNALPLDLCDAIKGGVDYVAFHDDGSLIGEPGMITSLSPRMTFKDTQCTDHPDECSRHCPGLCLRTMGLYAHIRSDENVKLEVTGDFIYDKIVVDSHFEIENDGESPSEFVLTSGHFNRKFFVTLPANGKYEAVFTLDDKHHWPVFAAVSYEDVVVNDRCRGAEITSFNLIPPAPLAGYCDNIIAGGSFEDGTFGLWTHLNDGVKVTDKISYSGSYALTTKYPSRGSMSLTYYLDSRCMTLGSTYEFRAKIILTDAHYNPIDCASKCIIAWALEISGGGQRQTRWMRLGMINGEYVKGWNDFTATLVVGEKFVAADSIAIVLSRPANGIYLILDDIEMVKIE